MPNDYHSMDATLVQGDFLFSSIQADTLFALRVLSTSLQQFHLESSVCIPFSHSKISTGSGAVIMLYSPHNSITRYEP